MTDERQRILESVLHAAPGGAAAFPWILRLCNRPTITSKEAVSELVADHMRNMANVFKSQGETLALETSIFDWLRLDRESDNERFREARQCTENQEFLDTICGPIDSLLSGAPLPTTALFEAFYPICVDLHVQYALGSLMWEHSSDYSSCLRLAEAGYLLCMTSKGVLVGQMSDYDIRRARTRQNG